MGVDAVLEVAAMMGWRWVTTTRANKERRTDVRVRPLNILLWWLGVLYSVQSTSAFTSLATTTTSSRSLAAAIPSPTRLNFFGPKDDGSPGDYVCLVRLSSWLEEFCIGRF